MRVFYSSTTFNIIVEGSPRTFTPRSLQYRNPSGSLIEIWTVDTEIRIAGPVDYTKILNEGGVGFASLADTLNYLQTQFTPGFFPVQSLPTLP